MELCTPIEICVHDDLLQWQPVYGVDGYNIHSGSDYLFSVEGGDTASAQIPTGVEGPFSVSAWKKVKDNVSIHSPRSKRALIINRLTEPEMEPPVLLEPCPEYSKDDAPEYVKQNYDLAFSDEFNQPVGSLPDPNKWRDSHLWGPYVTINNEEQFYNPALTSGNTLAPIPFKFDGNGMMGIEAGLIENPNDQNDNKQIYSGILTTLNSFVYQYGYAEWCGICPCPVGAWSAFWLLNRWYRPDPRATGANGKYQCELDPLEHVKGPGGLFGGGPYSGDFAYHALHWDDGACKIDGNGIVCRDASGAFTVPAASVQCPETGGNSLFINSGWNPTFANWCSRLNTVGVLWEENRVIYYVNRQPVVSVCDPLIVPQHPMYLLLNQAAGGNFPGPANLADYAQKPTLWTDYVRVWTNNPVPQAQVAGVDQRQIEYAIKHHKGKGILEA
jgi:beta-glucanase (GH16 family)